MKVRNSQLRDFLNTIKYDEELLKQMKEKFYLEKIQEAKDEKGVAQFRWNELPIEVEEKIMEWKKVVEMGGVVKARYTAAAGATIEGYMKEVIKKHHLTMKSFYRWIRKEYSNEDGDKVKDLPKFRYSDFGPVLSAMVNKECIFKVAWGDTNSSAPEAFRVLTKNKTPSLEEFIKYRKKEKNITKEENKKKTDEKNNKYDKVKIGSIYLKQGDVFKILSETKTQYRVEVLSMDDTRGHHPTGYDQDYAMMNGGGRYAGTRWSKIEWLKHKNISKKHWILNDDFMRNICPTHRAHEIEVEICEEPARAFSHGYLYYIKPV